MSLTIALVSAQPDWGGGEEQARVLASGLVARGHRVAIVARRGSALAQRMQSERFDVHEFAGKGRSPWALASIRRVLKQLRPDVLHANDSNALTAAGIASLGLGIPARIASRRVAFPLRWAWKYNHFADRVLCVSQHTLDTCGTCGVREEKLRLVHDGVDPARIAAGDRGRGRRALAVEDETVLLTVGKLTDCKGHTFLLYALPAVFARHPDAVAVLVGDGEQLAALREQARRLGIGHRVRFLGYRRDVPDLIHAADLYVLPSHVEGLCSTLLDAMLAGVPAVATTAGGIPDATGALDPYQPPTAWSVPAKDAPALARAIDEALRLPEERRLRASRAAARAQELFTAERMIESTLAVYREMV